VKLKNSGSVKYIQYKKAWQISNFSWGYEKQLVKTSKINILGQNST